ncbi:MAG: class I SAM-dependent methyltransferase [Planctomycetales bacterium]|nr:class I SAM-dependent methyltransferase [Planctomycetales bacterium]
MHPRIYERFERICAQHKWSGRVLEVGTIPDQKSLLRMRCLEGVREKLGLDLNGPFDCDGIPVVKGNANDLPFEDNSFDGVLCHAVIEHDPFFWRTVSEARRVAKPGGLIVFGGPAFVELTGESIRQRIAKWPITRKLAKKSRVVDCVINSTLCFRVHAAPGDYYRFGEQAFKEVILEGLDEIQTCVMMTPPRIIGIGRKPLIKSAAA